MCVSLGAESTNMKTQYDKPRNRGGLGILRHSAFLTTIPLLLHPPPPMFTRPYSPSTGYRKMNPFCIPFAITNMSGALLAMDLGFMGPNYAINTACATGNYCITNAAEHIRRG